MAVTKKNEALEKLANLECYVVNRLTKIQKKYDNLYLYATPEEEAEHKALAPILRAEYRTLDDVLTQIRKQRASVK